MKKPKQAAKAATKEIEETKTYYGVEVVENQATSLAIGPAKSDQELQSQIIQAMETWEETKMTIAICEVIKTVNAKRAFLIQ